MAYITLDELKEILPEILDQWIDKDDEGWEWIFQEIEQKCHIGTKRKGKKWKKYIEDDVYQLKSMVDAQSTAIAAHRNDINELNKKVDEFCNKLIILRDIYNAMEIRANRMEQDIKATKSMAQTAKQRTEVDYSQISEVKKTCETCKYNGRDEHSPCIACNHNNKWEAKDDG